MHMQSNSFTRRQLLAVSCFHERHWRLPDVVACKVLSSPPYLNKHDSLWPSLQSKMISSQIIEPTRSNEIAKEHSRDLYPSDSYEAAMDALSSLITHKKRGEKFSIGGKYSKLERMSMYLKILGLEDKIGGLKIIHVAGTKGKGSTCAFSEAILRECGFRTGLFASPHLIDVRERFRVDGFDISEEKFLQHFWDCWHQLRDKVTDELPMPPLFQFLTLMAFRIFVHEKVDVGIFEVGLGGRNDSTNVIKDPIVCGITSLGMDHMDTLGDTLVKIASHKAGIFKPNTPAFSVPQQSEAMDVLKERAQQLRVPLEVVSPLDYNDSEGLKLSLAGDHQFINAGLAVSLCKSWLRCTGNWERLFSNKSHEAELPDVFLRGLSSAHLCGRAQIVHDITPRTSNICSGGLTFFLDGAHSPESMAACASWYSKAVNEHDVLLSSLNSSFLDMTYPGKGNCSKISKRILLFNCMEVRNPQILLLQLVRTCASSGIHFSKAIFVPSISTYNKVISGSSINYSSVSSRDLRWQFHLQRIWEWTISDTGADFDTNMKTEHLKIVDLEALPSINFFQENYSSNNADVYHPSSAVISSLPLTIKWLRDCAKYNPSLRLQVLVTGSLHMVGDVLKLLQR